MPPAFLHHWALICLRGQTLGHCRPSTDKPARRLLGEGSRLRQFPIMLLRCAWPTPSTRTTRTVARPSAFKSILPHSSALSAPSDSLAPITCARTCEHTLMSDHLCVPSAAKLLPDSTIASDTRVCTRARRSLYARVISRLEASGVVAGGSPVRMLLAGISDLRRAASASSLYWMRK